MMEKARFLVLNEEALAELTDAQKPIFILEWLRHVESVLACISRIELKASQNQLTAQLLKTIQNCPGPPVRNLVAGCLASVFVVGDTVSLFDTVNKCNDLLKSKDDSPSSLTVKLGALCCLGEMYSRLGRMMGRSYEETVQIVSKQFKNMESQSRIETLQTFEKICAGMDTACQSVHKDIYKIAKLCLTDRVMAVRTAAARCIQQMALSAPLLYTSELESLTSLCFRALDGADYDGRQAISKLLGRLVSYTQRPPLAKGRGIIHGLVASASSGKSQQVKPVSLEECLSILMTGFLRGATTSLLRGGEIIKGTSGVNREVRVGVTHAYVAFVEQLGPSWLEKNLEPWTNHVLELVANPKAATSHVDAVYSRKCVNFILRRVFGRMLSEKAQFSVVKVLAGIVLKQMNSIDFNPENAKECNQETIFNQHLLVCALQELAALFLSLGTTMYHLVSDQSIGLVQGLFSVLIHPCQSTRLSAAWAVRCLCVAIPSEAHRCIERCLQAFDTMKTSPEAVAGYSAALAAILGGVRKMPLGVPHATGKIVFNTAEELLRTASQSSRLSIQRSAAGWLMIGAIMTMGESVVKALVPRMLLLWRNSFPKSAKELESEKQRGDAFTWQVTLEQRAGALSSIHSFLLHCPNLVTEEITQRLMVPIESALAMMTNLSGTLKQYGAQLKASAASLRWRLYQTLTLIKPVHFERSYTHMLRFVIWELTLNDNVANTTTSLFTRVCQSNSIFNSLVSDHVSIEDQLQPTGAAGSGAIEHDPCSLYEELPEGSSVPLPYPLGVAVIDSAIELFGLLYPHISSKHRTQLIDHFVECLKVTKYARKEAVLVNIFCGVLMAMRCIRRSKTSSGVAGVVTTPTTGIGALPVSSPTGTTMASENQALSPGSPSGGVNTILSPGGGNAIVKSNGVEELKLISQQLVSGSLGHASGVIRCAAAEVMGRICQAVQEPRFTAETAQYCADKLKSGPRDVSNRTGHSLALGCLHKYLGGMDSSRHQHGSVSILLNLAQDSSSPETQVWALHSLALVADTGGPLFRSYVEPSLSLVMKLVTTVPLSSVDLRQASGKMLSALITAVGPELQGIGFDGGPVDSIRKSFEIGCSLLGRSEEHPLVQNEAITCFQRLHLFGGTLNYDVVIPVLFRSMCSDNLLLRRSTVDCFRQLSQREAALVSKYFQKQVQLQEEDSHHWSIESGISGALFAMLDLESDEVIRKGIRDTVTSIFTSGATQDRQSLQVCIALCKNILTCDSSTGAMQNSPDEAGGDFMGDDDADSLKLANDDLAANNPASHSRWTSRVFAAELVRKILIASPFLSPTHQVPGPDLLRHLSDLIRMAFMGATSNSDQLRLEGLLNLETIIERFAPVRDPDFPTASILEQFQAQVGAALRPAFAATSTESDPMVMATACRVCSAWICGNSEESGEDLRRVHTLMVSALENLRTKPTLPDFNESANTLEKLAILKAWAEVFITAVEGNFGGVGGENILLRESGTNKDQLLRLVKPELELLCPLWISVLRDRALIELPPEFAPQLPREGGAFFSNDSKQVVRPYYAEAWPPILLASAICLSTLPDLVVGSQQNQQRSERFYLVFGLAMEALCKQPGQVSEEVERSTAKLYLKSLWALLSSHWPRDVISKEKILNIELCCVLHRQLVTRCDIQVQQLVIHVLRLVVEAVRENFNKLSEELKKTPPPDEEDEDKDVDKEKDRATVPSLPPSRHLEDGGSNSVDEVESGGNKSVVMSVLEVVFCLLMQKIPTLNSHVTGFQVKSTGSPEENDKLLANAVECLECLPDICSDEVAVCIQPTVMYLTSCILGEDGPCAGPESWGAVLKLYKKFVSHRLAAGHPQWERYLLSTLVKVLDMAKTGGATTDDLGQVAVQRQNALLTAIAMFIVRENGGGQARIPQVLYPSINMFQQAYQPGEQLPVRLKSIQLICQIFEKSESVIRTHFIHALAPRILHFLYGDEAKAVKSKAELELVLESVRAIQILVTLVDSSSKRTLETGVEMLTLIVPVLINFLIEPAALLAGGVGPHRKLLHDLSLQKLMKIGLQYREEFRALMSGCADMRLKLETVIKNSKMMEGQGGSSSSSRQLDNDPNSKPSDSTSSTSSANNTGTIKLKTDFSNFHASF